MPPNSPRISDADAEKLVGFILSLGSVPPTSSPSKPTNMKLAPSRLPKVVPR